MRDLKTCLKMAIFNIFLMNLAQGMGNRTKNMHFQTFDTLGHPSNSYILTESFSLLSYGYFKFLGEVKSLHSLWKEALLKFQIVKNQLYIHEN